MLSLKGVDLKNVDGFLGKTDSSFAMVKSLDNYFGTSDPFWEISDADHNRITQSTVIADSLNPIWPGIPISIKKLCKNDPDKAVYLTFYDFQADGRHQYMGAISTTVNQLLQSAGSGSLSFALGVDGVQYGKIFVGSAEIIKKDPVEIKADEEKKEFIDTNNAVIVKKDGELVELKPDQIAELQSKQQSAPPPPKASIHAPSPGIANKTKRLGRSQYERKASSDATYVRPSMIARVLSATPFSNPKAKQRQKDATTRIIYANGMDGGYPSGLPSGL